MRLYFVLIAIVMLMSACGADKTPDSPGEPAPPVPKIAEEARTVLDGANTVDATVEQAAEDARKEIDAQTQ